MAREGRSLVLVLSCSEGTDVQRSLLAEPAWLADAAHVGRMAAASKRELVVALRAVEEESGWSGWKRGDGGRVLEEVAGRVRGRIGGMLDGWCC